MSFPSGPRNNLWRHGRGTVCEIARQMIRSGHGLKGAALQEWHDRAAEFGIERTQPANELRDLIEQRHRMLVFALMEMWKR